MKMNPGTCFSMCSLYSQTGHAMCACFLGKDAGTVAALERLQSEGLLWAAMGAGVVSLHDLEMEINGRRAWDPGGADDRGFLAACEKAGIRVFGVVFTQQGYEVAVEIDRKAGKLLGFGESSGRGERAVWGLREFYRNAYPEIFRKWETFYRGKSDREFFKATGDFIADAACRDIDGRLSRAYWVNPGPEGYDFTVYFMCKNSPYWRRHLKRIIEMQIDAGAGGIQFDEPSTMELGGTRSGFCRHCREQFRDYLVEKHGKRYRGFDLQKAWRRSGAGIISELAWFRGHPLWKDWRLFTLRRGYENFAELAGHVKSVAKRKGRDVPVASNFAGLFPQHIHLSGLVDVFSFEYFPELPPKGDNLLFFELARALAGRKPVTAVPDIAFSSFLRERQRAAGDSNLLRYLIAEAAAGNGDFMVPYSCLTIAGAGAYYPSIEPVEEYKSFFKSLRLPPNLRKDAAVTLVLSFPSYFWTFDLISMPGRHFRLLKRIARLFTTANIQYDIGILGDGNRLEDSLDLSKSRSLLVIPHMRFAAPRHVERLLEFLERGGRAALVGDAPEFDFEHERLKNNPFERLRPGENVFGRGVLVWFHEAPGPYARDTRDTREKVAGGLWTGLMRAAGQRHEDASTVLPEPVPDVVAKVYRAGRSRFVHLLNLSYDGRRDAFRPAPQVKIDIASRFAGAARVFTPEDGEMGLKISRERGGAVVRVPGFKIHALVRLDP